MPRLLALVALLCLCLAAVASAQRVSNPADKLADRPLEGYQADRSQGCKKRAASGARALEAWMGQNFLGQSWGIFSCRKAMKSKKASASWSLHAEGRALDWHLDSSDPSQHRAAKKVVRMLLASDAAGNPHALARRMGVQEIIYNCQSWWAGQARLDRFSYCYGSRGKLKKRLDYSLAHRDHIHIGLNWAGARGKTSFWRWLQKQPQATPETGLSSAH